LADVFTEKRAGNCPHMLTEENTNANRYCQMEDFIYISVLKITV